MNSSNSLNPRIFPVFVYLSVIATIFLMFPLNDALAKSPRIEISPKTIRQGDAFIIKVKGIKPLVPPSATVGKKKILFSSCGNGCFIGIGAMSADARTGTHLVKVKIGERKKNLSLTVRKGTFQKKSMTLPEEKVILSPGDIEIVKEETDLLKTLFLAASERLWERAFLIPVDNRISTSFGTKRIMNKTWTSIHRGVDIQGSEGDEVRASNNGRVVLARELFFGGNTIILDHGQGIHTIYMHLSQMNVQPGNSVLKGDVIGLLGSTGRSTGPHLHFGVKISNVSVNPVSVLKLDL